MYEWNDEPFADTDIQISDSGWEMYPMVKKLSSLSVSTRNE